MESNFTLAQDSRLPQWYSLPVTAKRLDITLELTYWTNGDAEFELKGQGVHNSTLWGHSCWHPRTRYVRQADGTFRPPGGPEYVIVEVKGVVDVVEHDKTPGSFRMTDDDRIVREAKESRARGECRSSP